MDAGCGLRVGCSVPAYGSVMTTVVPAVRYNANWACEFIVSWNGLPNCSGFLSM